MDELTKLKLKNQMMMEQLFSVIEQNVNQIARIAQGDMEAANDSIVIGLANAVLGFYFMHVAEVAEGEQNEV